MPSGHIPTVLIVEDEALIAIELESIAMASGYAALTALDHAAALAALDGKTVDFALLDGTPQGVDEFVLARRLAERGIRFAFCTAIPVSTFPDDFKTATIIVKPFTEEDVAAVLLAALEG